MTKCRNIFAILLSVFLLLTFLPVTARAEGLADTEEPTQEEKTETGEISPKSQIVGVNPFTSESVTSESVTSPLTTNQDQTLTDNTPTQHTLIGEFTGSGGLTQSNQSYTVEVSKPQDSKPAETKPSKPQPAPEPAQPAVPDTGLPFTDVWRNNWFFEDVKWAYENGLMGGVSKTGFAPGDTVSLPGIVTVLARMSQTDLTQFDGVADRTVEPGKWYTNALIWAKRTGLLPDGTFLGGETPVTRDGLAVMLARYLRYSGVDVTPADLPSAFMDWEQMSREGYSAFQALHQYGVFKITDDGRMNPLGTATRAQFAALIHRVYALAAGESAI